MPFDPLILNRLTANDAQLSSLVCKEAQLGDEDIAQLCTALKNNTSLKELDLSNNKIGNEGARLLAEYLETNKTLHTLKLDNNKIGNKGAEAFVKCLRVSKYLGTLTLERNSIWFRSAISSEILEKINTLLIRRQPPNSLKILLHPLTHAGGASCLIHRFVNNEFTYNIEGTMGVDFYNKTQMVNGAPVKLQLFSGNGLDVYESIVVTYTRGSLGYVCCIETDSIMDNRFFSDHGPNSEMQRLKRRTEQYALYSDGPIFLVITKYDLISADKKDQFEKNITRLKAEYPHFPVFITSAKNGYGVDETFQKIRERIWELLINDNKAILSNAKDTSAKPSSDAVISMPVPEVIPPIRTFPPKNTEPVLENVLLTDPALKQHYFFLNALPPTSLKALETLGRQGDNLNALLPALSKLTANQKELTQRLQTVETQAGLDAQTLAEIAYIKKHEHLHRYYQALKTTLGQTFLAAKVIASGEVDATAGSATTVANGISTVAGALCPPAAPFLSFVAVVIGIGDGIVSSRATHTLSNWTDMENMAIIAANVARQLTFAQEKLLTNGLNLQAKRNTQYFKEKCSAFIDRIKSGATLTLEEGRAISDAKELLTYMKENKKPPKASVSDCIALLVQVIMGEDYTHASIGHANTLEKTDAVSSSSSSSTASAITQSKTITQEEWHTLKRKTEEAELKAEAAAKAATAAQKELEILRDKNTRSNHPNSSNTLDNGDGTVSLQQQDFIVSTIQGPMPLGDLIKSMQLQIAALEGGLGTTAMAVSLLHGAFNPESTQNNEALDEKKRLELLQSGKTNNSLQQKK